MTTIRSAALGSALTFAAVMAVAPAQAAPGDSLPAQSAPQSPAEAPTQPVAPAEPAQPAAPAETAQSVAAAEPAKASAATTKKRARTRVVVTVSTGPSRWRGPQLRHPRGYRFPAAVLRWANLVAGVMAEKDIPRRFLPGILAQIQQESSGNPTAVNNWDVNAARGTPSKGLLQVIAPTYRAYAKPGYTRLRYQTVPYTNIWAALEYVKNRYGMKKFTYWNRGYNQGY